MSGKFVLLGAGFSRAVGSAMPLLRDLGVAVLARLGLSDDTIEPFGDLEQWLSYLAQEQPWLDDSSNLRNRALFRDVAQAVASEIEAAQDKATERPPVSWLTRLVWDWSATSAQVATFNYDTLLELATSDAGLVSTWADLYAMSLEKRTAPGDNFMFATERPGGPTLTLYKLHGSTNWYYGGLAAPVSDRVVLAGETQYWPKLAQDPPQLSLAGRHRALLDDLEPMIVPPTGTKGPYYGNLSLRAQWRRAFAALAESDELLIIGYSFPASDLVTRHLLATSGFSGAVIVIDQRDEVRDAVATLLPHAEITGYTGGDAVGSFVQEVCGHVVGWTGRRSDDGGWTPEVSLDGQAVTDFGLPPTCDSYDAALAVAATWVDARWPGLRSDAPTIKRPGDGAPIELAYLTSPH